MQKILGLDMGSYSIKAVEIICGYKTLEIKNVYEAPIPHIEGIAPELVGLTALKQLFADKNISVDKIFISLTGLYVSTRVFHLKNIKKRNIPMVIQNELENQAPFILEDSIIDHQILDVREGVTSVLAVSSKREYLESYLSILKNMSLEPKVIDVDYLSFMNLYSYLNFSNRAEGGCHLVLDIGHFKTSLILFNKDKFVTARILLIGGKNFTEFLSKQFHVSFEEAQRLKHFFSFIPLEQTETESEDQKNKVGWKLRQALDELVWEIARTLHVFKVTERLSPQSITLVGSHYKIENLKEYLSASLSIPVETLSLETNRVEIDEKIDIQKFGQAMAIGLRGVPNKNQSQINLRKGELALTGSYGQITDRVFQGTLMALGLILCLMGSYGLRWWLYSRQIDLIKQDYRKEVVQLMNNNEDRQLKNIAAKSSWDFKMYSDKSYQILSENVKIQKDILNSFMKRKPVLPLWILEELSKAIPKTLKVDITQFSLQGNQIGLEAETTSFAISDKIVSLIKESGLFESVQKKSQENKPGSDGKIVKFSLAAQIKEGF